MAFDRLRGLSRLKDKGAGEAGVQLFSVGSRTSAIAWASFAPAGIKPGDLLLAFAGGEATVPSGYTLVASDGSAANATHAFSRIATATAADEFAFTGNRNKLLVFRGHGELGHAGVKYHVSGRLNRVDFAAPSMPGSIIVLASLSNGFIMSAQGSRGWVDMFGDFSGQTTQAHQVLVRLADRSPLSAVSAYFMNAAAPYSLVAVEVLPK